MRLSKTPCKKTKDATKQIKKYFKTDEELVSLVITYLGQASAMLDFLADTYGNPQKIHELPYQVRYAMAMTISHHKLFGQIVRGEIKEGIDLRHMPVTDDSWSNPETISEKLVLVVKNLHKQLQEEGKL